MRWERLFEELDARFDAEASLERDAEIADRTRRERAQIPLYSRLLANVGRFETHGGALEDPTSAEGPSPSDFPESQVHESSSALPATWVPTGS